MKYEMDFRDPFPCIYLSASFFAKQKMQMPFVFDIMMRH